MCKKYRAIRFLALLFLGILSHSFIYSEIHLGIMGSVFSHSKKLKQKLDDEFIYPNTDGPPELTIKFWATINSTDTANPEKYPIPVDMVLDNGIGSFGLPKGGTPSLRYSDQMTIWLASSSWKPIYALADGVVVCLHKGYDQDHQVIKYGKNWAIEYCHFAELNPELYIGKIVRKGDYIGRMVPMKPDQNIPQGTGYFEYRLLRKNAQGNWIAVNPYNYLDSTTKENIKQIWLKKRNKTWGDYDYFGNYIAPDDIHHMSLREIDRGDEFNYNTRILYDYWKGENFQSGYYEPPPEE